MTEEQHNNSNDFETVNNIGMCQLHRRANECFCTICHVVICPDCLMFDAHKGHIVCRIQEASIDLRNRMDEAAKAGLFKIENTENILLDIRHTRLTCEESKQKIISEIDQTFTNLIKTLKTRKQEVLTEVEKHFNGELEKLQICENKWSLKQEYCLDVLNYVKSNDDITIIKNANQIIKSIEDLRESLNYERIQLINSMNTNLYLGKEKSNSTDLNFKELIKSIEKFVKKGEMVTLQFRC